MRLPYAVCAYMDQNSGIRGRKLALCVSLRSLHTHGSIAMREIAPAYHHLEALETTQIIDMQPMDASGVVRMRTHVLSLRFCCVCWRCWAVLLVVGVARCVVAVSSSVSSGMTAPYG